MSRLDALFYFFENLIWDMQRSRKKLLTFVGTIAGVVAAVLLFVNVILPHINYGIAMGHVKKGEYAEATQILKKLGDFKDSEEYTRIYSLLAAEPGDKLFFGSFEQDNNLDNGPEDLEWIVLDTDGDKVLLTTSYLIQPLAFSKNFDMATWDISGARAWCNNDFYNVAFDEDERSAVVLTHLESPMNPTYPDRPAGEATDDYVFLLSLEEAEQYFPKDETKYAYATDYAAAQGALVHKETGCSWWWLRTVGADRMLSCAVHASYQIVFNVADYYGSNVSNPEGCIRPVIWVDSELYASTLDTAE